MTRNAEQVADGFMFPESPRWHVGRGAFVFSDIDRGEIHEWRPDAGSRRLYSHTGMISGLAFETADCVLVCDARECTLIRVDLTTGRCLGTVADFGPIRGWGINDMVRAADGTCYVDSVDFDFMAASRGEIERKRCRLLIARPDGSVAVASDEMFFPNGMAITPDGRQLIVADTRDRCLGSLEIAIDGSLGPRRIFASFPDELPEGMCLDASGATWVANHGRVVRVSFDGVELDEVFTGEARATACMLGGSDGRTLLITASDTMDREVMRHHPSGRLFQVHVDVPGAGLPSVY